MLNNYASTYSISLNATSSPTNFVFTGDALKEWIIEGSSIINNDVIKFTNVDTLDKFSAKIKI